MALFDFLKRKKEAEKAQIKKVHPVKSSEAGVLPLAKQFNRAGKISTSKKNINFSYDIVKDPHISEKATRLSEKNQYIFKVHSKTNKIEIKKAVEGIYGVDVLSVNVIKIPPKKRRLGKIQGFKAGHAKAIVKIKDGQKIEIL